MHLWKTSLWKDCMDKVKFSHYSKHNQTKQEPVEHLKTQAKLKLSLHTTSVIKLLMKHWNHGMSWVKVCHLSWWVSS